jgi:hypothetical protein
MRHVAVDLRSCRRSDGDALALRHRHLDSHWTTNEGVVLVSIRNCFGSDRIRAALIWAYGISGSGRGTRPNCMNFSFRHQN